MRRYPVHHFDGLEPPQVRLELSADLNHHSTTTGLGTPSSRFKLAAEDIGKQLGKSLVKKLNDIHEKDGPLPPLPDAFYPPYVPPPDLPLPPDESVEPVASYHGLMSSNESLWRVATTRELADVLVDFEARLKESGWRTESLETEAGSLPNLRMSRGEDVISVYPQRALGRSATGMGAVEAPNETPPVPTPSVFVHYLDRMSHQEAAEAVAVLLDRNYPVETLLGNIVGVATAGACAGPIWGFANIVFSRADVCGAFERFPKPFKRTGKQVEGRLCGACRWAAWRSRRVSLWFKMPC